jgi:hypothetical protein
MRKRAMPKEAITPAEYRAFQEAYDFFNAELFAGSLPHVLVTLQRHAKTSAYFSPERFSGRNEAKVTAHELAMNPDSFTGRTDESILSTLAHEMAHVWQQTHGTPPRRSYHDRQWAAKMKSIGLQPSDTGEPGGKETGQKMNHYVTPAGAFERATAELLQAGFALSWADAAIQDRLSKPKKSGTRVKYTCPDCGANAWGKDGLHLICADCDQPMTGDTPEEGDEDG